MSGVNQLGNYLKDRRAKLDPTAFGFPLDAAAHAGASGARKWRSARM